MKEHITHFLSQNPSLSDILNFVEQEAQRIAKEREAAGSHPQHNSEHINRGALNDISRFSK